MQFSKTPLCHLWLNMKGANVLKCYEDKTLPDQVPLQCKRQVVVLTDYHQGWLGGARYVNTTWLLLLGKASEVFTSSSDTPAPPPKELNYQLTIHTLLPYIHMYTILSPFNHGDEDLYPGPWIYIIGPQILHLTYMFYFPHSIMMMNDDALFSPWPCLMTLYDEWCSLSPWPCLVRSCVATAASVSTSSTPISRSSSEEEAQGIASTETPPVLPVQSPSGQESLPPPELGACAL